MTKKFFIYDNFLPDFIANDIEKMFTSNDVPYYFHPNSCGEYDNPYYDLYLKNKDKIVEAPQFCHYFYDWHHEHPRNSDYMNYPLKVLNVFKDKFDDISFNLIRMKANMQLQNKKSDYEYTAMPHRDFNFEHVVLLYYVNDSDGDTILFEDTDTTNELKIAHRIQPKKNRLLVFDGNWLHSSSVPIKSEYRVVFNYDLEVFEK